LVDNFFN